MPHWPGHHHLVDTILGASLSDAGPPTGTPRSPGSAEGNWALQWLPRVTGCAGEVPHDPESEAGEGGRRDCSHGGARPCPCRPRRCGEGIRGRDSDGRRRRRIQRHTWGIRGRRIPWRPVPPWAELSWEELSRPPMLRQRRIFHRIRLRLVSRTLLHLSLSLSLLLGSSIPVSIRAPARRLHSDSPPAASARSELLHST